MRLNRLSGILGIFVLTLPISTCTPKQPGLSSLQLTEFNRQSAEADKLYAIGSYLSLKKAFEIYESQMGFPAFRSRTKIKLLKTALLLSLRENELMIVENRHFTRAVDLIESQPELSEFSPPAALVVFTSLGGTVQIRGDTSGEYSLEASFDWINENVVDMNACFKEKAESDPFYAYCYMTLKDKFRYNLEEEDDFERLGEVYEDSPLIEYKLSIFSKLNRGRIEALVEENPDFYESYFHLGSLALLEGNAITAEKNLMKALDRIPSSISILKNLAQISYRLEEFEESLEYNDKILMYLPSYRDALLGKAICLSYLGRHDEAAAILRTLIEMGMYLMGESHYWMAWNLNEMERLDLAMDNVKMALNYLIGHHEVHLLAGIIAFKRGDYDGSEDHLNKVLRINKGDCEALFYMGKIHSIRENWEQSGIHFENAALCNGVLEIALKNKIDEIEQSSFPPARKEKQMARKKMQLKKVQITKATAFYNAAAGFFNAGMPDKAKSLAQLAREHSSIQSLADELILKIKYFIVAMGNKK